MDAARAYDMVVQTTEWRLQENVDDLTWHQYPPWFEQPFAYFHSFDRLGQPIAIVHVSAFPTDALAHHDLAAYLQQYASVMMEIARRWMWEETQTRQATGDPMPLALELTVIVDLHNAPFLVLDYRALRHLSNVMEQHYPRTVGNIHVLNFGWVHHSLWQLFKLVLPENTKNRITFVSNDQLTDVVAKEHLLLDFGGLDPFVFDPFSDSLFQKFGHAVMKSEEDRLPPSPAPSNRAVDEEHEGEMKDMFFTGLHDDSTQVDWGFLGDDDHDDEQQSHDSHPHPLHEPVSTLASPASVLSYFGLSQHQIGLRTGIDHTASFYLPLKTNQLDFPHKQPMSAPASHSARRYSQLVTGSQDHSLLSLLSPPSMPASSASSIHLTRNHSHPSTDVTYTTTPPHPPPQAPSALLTPLPSDPVPAKLSFVATFKLAVLSTLLYVGLRILYEVRMYQYLDAHWDLSRHDLLLYTIGSAASFVFLLTPILVALVE
ncbi:CRAL/TRIO domain-containing protein [Hesseltinella vesiculosa]|uniref:CRAL/TRIO domain-containing protein n=1 Tax=Hesseltinella vesiculosa TaxID=101127 RepID=A0A1X2G3K0_9FUNG|nr:CRAL/TRIO domain-containing protein [Hesseltinella vesiculosa]